MPTKRKCRICRRIIPKNNYFRYDRRVCCDSKKCRRLNNLLISRKIYEENKIKYRRRYKKHNETMNNQALNAVKKLDFTLNAFQVYQEFKRFT